MEGVYNGFSRSPVAVAGSRCLSPQVFLKASPRNARYRTKGKKESNLTQPFAGGLEHTSYVLSFLTRKELDRFVKSMNLVFCSTKKSR
jgi:hypothetical protein